MRAKTFFASPGIFLLFAIACAAQAGAATRLATEGNVHIPNPYADPADGYFGFRIASGDFDADGIDDMVISELGNFDRFRVLRGKAYAIGGPYPISRFTSTTVMTVAYGSILATGDFDGDGTHEVALGDRFSGSLPGGGGAVHVYKRAPDGVWSLQETIRQGSNGYAGADDPGDRFGSALASGDFDNDGYDDLAIGVPGEDTVGNPTLTDAGAVHMVHGSPTGLTGTGDQIILPSSDGLGIGSDNSDQYGYALAVGDFNNDDYDDLAIGVPNRACPAGSRSGGVTILNGASFGLSTSDGVSIQPGQAGMLGDCSLLADFGSALSAGRLSPLSPYDGLAIGAPLTDVGGVEKAGAVYLAFGSSEGVTTENNRFITPADLPGGVPLEFGQFANQVHLGKLRSSRVNLVVSSGSETVAGRPGAGAAWVLSSVGAAGAIGASTAERWVAGGALRIGPPADEDRFGASFAIGDFNGDGANDLVIGAYQHAMGDNENAGGAQVIYQSEFIFRDDFDPDGL